MSEQQKARHGLVRRARLRWGLSQRSGPHGQLPSIPSRVPGSTDMGRFVVTGEEFRSPRPSRPTDAAPTSRSPIPISTTAMSPRSMRRIQGHGGPKCWQWNCLDDEVADIEAFLNAPDGGDSRISGCRRCPLRTRSAGGLGKRGRGFPRPLLVSGDGAVNVERVLANPPGLVARRHDTTDRIPQ